jgi:hypothetical protein
MLYMLLVFGHLLASAMALGAIVATDLRMLSRLAHDRVRIPPPNPFVARLVTIGLVLLWATGAGILAIGLQRDAGFVTPKLQAKLVLVVLITLNAWLLHRVTFPRLARGRRVARWGLADYAIVAPPVALSNALWLLCAFLGIARPWNATRSLPEVMAVAAAAYAFALLVVVAVLAVAGSSASYGRMGLLVWKARRALATIGTLGRDEDSHEPDASSRQALHVLRDGDLRPVPSLPSVLPPMVVALHAHRALRVRRRA